MSKEFVLAGDAIFTIETPTNGYRTYHVRKAEPTPRYPNSTWFVKLLTGPDNTSDYTYLGRLDDHTGQLVLTAKSAMGADSFPVRLLNKVLARVWTGDHAAYERHGFKTHHEGRCGRCGARLTVPESIESGFGPECVKIVGGKTSRRLFGDDVKVVGRYKSRSKDGEVYHVTKGPQGLICTCPGWTHNHNCWHVDRVLDREVRRSAAVTI